MKQLTAHNQRNFDWPESSEGFGSWTQSKSQVSCEWKSPDAAWRSSPACPGSNSEDWRSAQHAWLKVLSHTKPNPLLFHQKFIVVFWHITYMWCTCQDRLDTHIHVSTDEGCSFWWAHHAAQSSQKAFHSPTTSSEGSLVCKHTEHNCFLEDTPYSSNLSQNRSKCLWWPSWGCRFFLDLCFIICCLAVYHGSRKGASDLYCTYSTGFNPQDNYTQCPCTLPESKNRNWNEIQKEYLYLWLKIVHNLQLPSRYAKTRLYKF